MRAGHAQQSAQEERDEATHLATRLDRRETAPEQRGVVNHGDLLSEVEGGIDAASRPPR